MMKPRYRLRTFLIFVTLFCVICGTVGVRMYQKYQTSQSVERIRNAGGMVFVRKAGEAHRVYLQGAKFGDEELRDLIPYLRQLPQLHELDLIKSPVTDEGLQVLSEIRQIRELYLFETGTSEAGVSELQRAFPELEIKLEMPDPIASSKISTNIYRHAINSLALGASGKNFVTGSGDGTLRWWDLKSNQPQRKVAAHTKWLFSTAFSPDGELLATAGGDSKIKLWNVATGEQVGEISAHADDVHSIAFSPDGQTLFSSGDDMTVRKTALVQRSDSKVEVEASQILGYHEDTVPCVAVSADGSMVASGGRDDKIHLWNAHDGSFLRELMGSEDDIYTLTFLPEEKDGSPVLLSGCYDGTVQLWNTQTGETIASKTLHRGRVYSVAVSDDGQRIASGGEDGVIVWDRNGLVPLSRKKFENVSCLRFDAGRRLFVSDAMGTVRVVELPSSRIVHRVDTARAVFVQQ